MGGGCRTERGKEITSEVMVTAPLRVTAPLKHGNHGGAEKAREPLSSEGWPRPPINPPPTGALNPRAKPAVEVFPTALFRTTGKRSCGERGCLHGEIREAPDTLKKKK